MSVNVKGINIYFCEIVQFTENIYSHLTYRKFKNVVKAL